MRVKVMPFIKLSLISRSFVKQTVRHKIYDLCYLQFSTFDNSPEIRPKYLFFRTCWLGQIGNAIFEKFFPYLVGNLLIRVYKCHFFCYRKRIFVSTKNFGDGGNTENMKILIFWIWQIIYGQRSSGDWYTDYYLSG